ncbi:hypothetical protein HME9302_00100 [Alteripontixanthobacter maritimus]|uniref:DUF5681 domain-containing protein n=1 Tax=Alteripontixanthobacter maritimus TaxID=2161824 RepID=A0A369Q2D1_9SPHN|nr:DUF5681 domain-containing protein [Alteripontixanthobacter maritimus]RDC58924.1 hypothetical protein HME9302_00100 [Alteripontixanthobacter maritimus]
MTRVTSEEYAVGHGKPPPEHRFQKGRSGNPKGRPKGSKNRVPQSHTLEFGTQPANQMLMEEVYRPVTLREGDTTIQLPAIQAVFRSMSVKAVKGDRFAQRLIAELVQGIESADRETRTEHMKTMMEYKADAERAIERAPAAGEPEPAIIPHPDDIYLDMVTPKAYILGPQTKDDKREWDRMLARRNNAQGEVSEFANAYRRARKPDKKVWLQEQWHFEQKMYDMLNDGLPPRYRTVLKDRSFADGASQAGMQRKNDWPNER